MANLLQGVVQDGTGRRAKALGRPAAGKTGTTNNLNDAWFIGFIPDLTATVWVGYDTEKELGKFETGSRAAIPIWLKYMQSATKDTPVKNFDVPDDNRVCQDRPRLPDFLPHRSQRTCSLRPSRRAPCRPSSALRPKRPIPMLKKKPAPNEQYEWGRGRRRRDRRDLMNSIFR